MLCENWLPLFGIMRGGIGDETAFRLTFGASNVSIRGLEEPDINGDEADWRFSLLLSLVFDMSSDSPLMYEYEKESRGLLTTAVVVNGRLDDTLDDKDM